MPQINLWALQPAWHNFFSKKPKQTNHKFIKFKNFLNYNKLTRTYIKHFVEFLWNLFAWPKATFRHLPTIFTHGHKFKWPFMLRPTNQQTNINTFLPTLCKCWPSVKMYFIKIFWFGTNLSSGVNLLSFCICIWICGFVS